MKRMIWIGIVSAILGIIVAQVIFSVAIAAPLIPPPEYDHAFAGVLTVTRVYDRGKMEEICQKPRAIGCALLYTVGGCHIYIRHAPPAHCAYYIFADLSARGWALQWMAGRSSDV
jgi:hypothetical protein